MRVLHVVEVTHGGVVTLARAFAAHQDATGHEVHVLAPAGAGAFAGTTHHWAPVRRRPGTWPSTVRDLHRVVASVQPDVVHLHSFFPGLLGRIRKLPGRPAVVYQPHSWAFAAAGRESLARLVAAWERRALRNTDLTITNCRQELDEARARGVSGAARVVGLPLDTDHFAPSSRAEARRTLGLDDRRLLVCVGRLSRQKGQAPLAAAWEASPLPDTVLALVGPGDAGEVQAAAPTTTGGSLLLAGSCDDVRPWIAAADVCVMPSLYEGQSVAMAEALAGGRPVMITDVNGAQEAVAPPGEPSAGAVVPVGAMTDLLEACAVRLGDAALLERESATARERAVALFAADEVMARVVAAYAVATGGTTDQAGSTPTDSQGDPRWA